jgi:alpha-2-macroglobulin
MRRYLMCLVAGIVFGLTAVSTRPGLGVGEDVWMNVNVPGNVEPGEAISGGISGRNFSEVHFKLIWVDLEEVISQVAVKGYGFSLNELQLKKISVVKEWNLKFEKSGNDYDWVTKEFKIDNPGVGAYIIEASSEGVVRTQMMIVSGIATVVKSDDRRMVVFVADRRTGEAKSGADVAVIKKDGTSLRAKTGDDGLASFDVKSGDELPVIASWNDNAAAADVYFYSGNDYANNSVYMYTDRPVYRPDQTVYIRGIFRQRADGKYKLPDAAAIKLTISDPLGNEVLKTEAKLTDFGTFSAEYKLGPEPPLGGYGISVQLQGNDYYSSFKVEEYRKPEYEITVSPVHDAVVQGEPLLFTLKAAYYFGEPVKAADVKYTLYRRLAYHYWFQPYSWYYKSTSRMISWYGGYGDEVAKGGGRTDESGEMEIIFSDTASEQDMQYTLVATVTEKGRREVNGEGAAEVKRGEFNLDVRTDRYMSSPGEKVWITTTATDLHGKPVSRALSLSIYRIDWKDEKRTEQKVFETTVETSANGEARTAFTPDEDGYYHIVVSGVDGRKNIITGEAHLYVASGGGWRSYYSEGAIELILDRDRYAPGDEARLLINSSLGDVPALLTFEGGSLLDARIVQLKGGAAYYTFKVTADFQPNTEISVCVIKDNQLQQMNVTLVAPPEDKFLTVTISSDKSVYKPGEKAHVKITARDRDGNPADTELSLGAVDEALYAVAPEETQDIREFFYGPRVNGVDTQSSFSFYSYGDQPVEAPMAMDAMGGRRDMLMKTAAAPEAAGLVQPEIRSYFPDNAYWGPHIVTGGDGEADVEFTMPDSLTTWRLTSRGVTRDTSVGETKYEVVARKNVMVRLETPRFFTQGDKQAITAVAHNYLETEKEVHMILNADGIKLLESNEKTVRIPAGGDVRVEWRAVVEAPRDAWLTVKALTDEESDAMQLTIPVLPHGTPARASAAGEVGFSEKFTIAMPAGHVPGTQKLTLALAPSLTAGMFDALEYLAGYPYGCVEQTMSRFLPDVVIAKALQQSGHAPAGKLTELPKMVKDGLDRLADMQHEDGAWGWWKTDESNPYMTAYVIFGLVQARLADFEVPPRMFDRGVEALKMLLDKETDPDRKAYLLFALAEAGKPDAVRTKKVFTGRNKLTPYGKAVLAIACKKAGLDDEATRIVRDLEKSASPSPKTIAFWSGPSDRYWWMDNSVETTAFVLMALIECDHGNALIPGAVRYLNAARRGDHWYSTKDTAVALMALTQYMLGFEDPHPDYLVTVKMNGETVDTKHITEQDVNGEGVRIDLSDKVITGKNEIEIVKDGAGSLYYAAALDYYEASDWIGARANGIKVNRWFSWDVAGKKKIKSKTRLKSGDKIWAQIVVVSPGRYDYLVVENYLPSGFEVDKNEWERTGVGYWVNREVRDEKVVFFIDYMWDKERRFVVPLVAETPGEVAAMPCSASLMYFPDVNGRSSEERFTVEAK